MVTNFASLRVRPKTVVALACVCAAAALVTIHDAVLRLFLMWRGDDLKSMGLIVPFVAAALILRSWRSMRWQAQGSWWGVALLLLTAAVTFWRRESMFLLTVHGDWLVQIPPFPLVAMAYAAAIVLIFGGVPLLRRAWFGVALMLLVIPVPSFFSGFVDLPLQRISAGVARGFAHLLGAPLTQDRLRLMFTPEFGMFIAPGCNGIRGAVTLGLSALIVGYLYRFRWFVYAPVVAGAVLLGYVFNLLRLCALVVYYKIALPYPWLQDRATGADYIIGAALFLLALTIFFTVANRLRRDPEDVLPKEPVPDTPLGTVKGWPVAARVAAVLALVVLFVIDMRHETKVGAQSQAVRVVHGAFPQQIAGWTLHRTWNEQVVTGTIVYAWAEYQAPAGGTGSVVDIGISPSLGLHDVTVCHLIRGESAVVNEPMKAQTAAGPVPLSVALYNDGETQHLEAATSCEAGSCQQFTSSTSGVSLVYTKPRRFTPLSADETRPVPVLIMASTADMSLSAAAATSKLEGDVRAFMAGLNLPVLTAPYER